MMEWWNDGMVEWWGDGSTGLLARDGWTEWTRWTFGPRSLGLPIGPCRKWGYSPEMSMGVKAEVVFSVQ